MNSLIIRWYDIEYGSIDVNECWMFQTIWNYVWNIENFASLHKKMYRHDHIFETLKTYANLCREMYWDDLELCWNGRAFKSAYSILDLIALVITSGKTT